ncbi:hypothetical protein [Paracoccus albus]|uniref:hypothetical protein n=1 Tax=Paracoccus albus TaxID=3017784 RepID=UPI0022F07DDE|nr:hypothetical protein [Paracoccus albus]WBU60912.1 hypothetical protein PAF20_03035 [Paracoccus albus]
MRFLLACLLAILLVVTMPLALTGAASAEASSTVSAANSAVSLVTHKCCAPQQKSSHDDCAACAAISDAEITPDAARLPRRTRQSFSLRNMDSASLRVPIPPPRSVAL